jgi:hypothetical protein
MGDPMGGAMGGPTGGSVVKPPPGKGGPPAKLVTPPVKVRHLHAIQFNLCMALTYRFSACHLIVSHLR